MLRIDLAAVLAAGASLVVVVGGMAAAALWFRRWVRAQVATPAQAAAQQLRTSNGTTVAGYVEQAATDMADLRREVGALTTLAMEGRDVATAAHALASKANDRLDAHLLHHG